MRFVRPTFKPQMQNWQVIQHGPALVAVGLVILIVVVAWPAVPATTGMALVALGATRATLARSPGLAVVMLHAVTYVMLYAVFFGSACHLMATRAGSDPWRALDLVVSVWPMTLAVALLLGAVGRGCGAAGDPSGRG